jgi:hypothetical protein
MKKFTQILAFAILTLTLSSCLKDKGYEDNKYGINVTLAEQDKIINMPVTGTTFTLSKGTISAASTAGGTANVTTLPIHLSAKYEASEDVAVTVASDAARLATYNATLATASQYVQVPDAKYTLSNAGVTTIPKGSRDAGGVIVTFTPSALGVGRWAIPVSIKSVDKSGYIISGNQAYRIILVVVTP